MAGMGWALDGGRRMAMGCEGGQGQTVAIPVDARGLPALLRVLGPSYLVAVGYMDPGNWATDLAAGSTYGYSLLWVVALSSLMAVLLQSLCCRLGIAPRAWIWPRPPDAFSPAVG